MLSGKAVEKPRQGFANTILQENSMIAVMWNVWCSMSNMLWVECICDVREMCDVLWGMCEVRSAMHVCCVKRDVREMQLRSVMHDMWGVTQLRFQLTLFASVYQLYGWSGKCQMRPIGVDYWYSQTTSATKRVWQKYSFKALAYPLLQMWLRSVRVRIPPANCTEESQCRNSVHQSGTVMMCLNVMHLYSLYIGWIYSCGCRILLQTSGGESAQTWFRDTYRLHLAK
jgi:hypothetical protein